MATANPVPGLQGPLGVAKKITGWYIAAAVLFIVLGIFAIIEPGVASLGVTLLVGWLLIIGAVGHLIAAFKGGGAKQVIFQLLIALVYFIGGIYFLTHPILAVSTLTLLLACLIWFQWPSSTVWAIGILVGVNLLMTGITRLMFGLAVRKVIPQT